MKKSLLVPLFALLVIFSGWFVYRSMHSGSRPFDKEARVMTGQEEEGREEKGGGERGENEEKEDGIRLAQEQEFELTKDISLGYIPKSRLVTAYENLRRLRASLRPAGVNQASSLTWAERGPNTDATGPSNGNTRAGSAVTSGRMRAIWVDLADATNKSVWVGGIDGGIWKTTDITASPASWTLVNDFFSNLSIASICQDPTNTNIMYFGTGEKAFNADAVRGGGVWKSTDHGVNWSLLSSTTGFWNVSKIACDAAGNVYVATIGNNSGIQRSTDGGSTWTNISPTGLSLRIPDMKISSTGRLHIVCGYYNTAAGSAGYRYTDTPATVTSAGWTSPTTSFTPVQYNCELAVAGNTLYVLNSSSSFQTPQLYKSIDGGANWAVTTTSPPAASGTNDLSSGQGWYCLALAVDPANDNNVIAGGLNCYRTTNGGTTWTQVSTWVGTTGNYVHADQHTAVWTGNQVLVGSDGGIFYSANSGATFADRNAGLRLKQFYACAIHPSTTNYFLAGAQDNGCHQLTSAGLGGSVEVTGGDGAFVHIDQNQPQYQFGSYVYGQYRRSTDAGSSWSSVNYSTSAGQFINPTDYDDGNNIMYTGGSSGQYVRWDNPQTGSTFTPVSVAAFSGSVISVTVSPYTSNRVFFGTNGAKIVKTDNANTASPTATDITGSGMTVGSVSCIATGTSDNDLLATFSNYGVTHVWVSSSGGGSGGWTNISGNLPDIPVRWAMFYPDDNTKAIIATEMGVYETSLINGASTVWTQDPSFPIVRTNMLQYRRSDGTILAATHGRGLWTASIPTSPYIRYQVNYSTQGEATSGTSGCRGYTDYTVNMTIDAAPAGDATVSLSVAGGSTAVQGADFDFTTNGSFSSPSSQLTFLNGATTSQPVTIRVYDDAAVEATESFTLSYIVSGTTNAVAAPGNPAYTMTITDNDVAAVVPGVLTNFTVGDNSVSLSGATAFRSNQQKHRVQALFLASELTAKGMTAGSISAITMRVTTKNSTKAYTGYTVSMGSTASTNLSTGFISPAMTQVYTGNYTSAAGSNVFAFGTGSGSSSTFTWDGVSNIVIQYCFDNSPSAADASADVMEGSNPFGTGAAAANYATTYSNGGASSGCALAAASISNSRVDVTFTEGVAGNPIETVLNAGKTAYLGPNKDVYFYNANGDIIAHITNLSAFDYGCTQVTVDRAGSTSKIFWNNNTANYLMEKTLHVVPTNNNPTGQYQITLYFTAAEKSGWETNTGQSFGSIQLVKAAGQISLVTPSTPAAAGTVEVVTPTTGTYGSDYTLTYTFSSGFSGFGAGIPATSLPVTLLGFSGRLDNNVIPLSWSTSSEQNSAYFEVQKSVDGTSFYPLAKVTAAGNSNTERRYGYTDKEVNAENYYRLRMVDIDGKFTYSQVVVIKSPGVQQQVWVVNNPFRSYIDIRLARLPQQQVRAELVTMSGVVAFSRVYAGALQMRLDLGGASLSAGTYLLRTTVDGRRFTNKVVKQ